MAPNIPLPSSGATGETPNKTATATCFCGSIQLSFPTTRPSLIDTFICNCTDCRKITASMFATNFIIPASSLLHTRGQHLLTKYSQSTTIATGNIMENHFCSVCGSLMYRISSGFPENVIMRVGTVDDFHLHEGVLKPRVEQFCKDRVGWLEGGKGVKQVEGNYYGGSSANKL